MFVSGTWIQVWPHGWLDQNQSIAETIVYMSASCYYNICPPLKYSHVNQREHSALLLYHSSLEALSPVHRKKSIFCVLPASVGVTSTWQNQVKSQLWHIVMMDPKNSSFNLWRLSTFLRSKLLKVCPWTTLIHFHFNSNASPNDNSNNLELLTINGCVLTTPAALKCSDIKAGSGRVWQQLVN